MVKFLICHHVLCIAYPRSTVVFPWHPIPTVATAMSMEVQSLAINALTKRIQEEAKVLPVAWCNRVQCTLSCDFPKRDLPSFDVSWCPGWHFEGGRFPELPGRSCADGPLRSHSGQQTFEAKTYQSSGGMLQSFGEKPGLPGWIREVPTQTAS